MPVAPVRFPFLFGDVIGSICQSVRELLRSIRRKEHQDAFSLTFACHDVNNCHWLPLVNFRFDCTSMDFVRVCWSQLGRQLDSIRRKWVLCEVHSR